MVITILSTDLLLQHNGEKSGAISRDVRKSAYSELPLSRRVLFGFSTFAFILNLGDIYGIKIGTSDILGIKLGVLTE